MGINLNEVQSINTPRYQFSPHPFSYFHTGTRSLVTRKLTRIQFHKQKKERMKKTKARRGMVFYSRRPECGNHCGMKVSRAGGTTAPD